MRSYSHSIVVILVVLFVFGCKGKNESQLAILDSFVEVNPDSTYSVLQGMKKELPGFDEDEKMHYGLLRLKCQNALGLAFDSIDTIKEIVNHYNKKGVYNKTLLSIYLMGRAYMEGGDEPMAVECFNSCLSLKNKAGEDVDYIQLSKVHSQLDYIYSDQNLPQYELRELNAAANDALLGGDSLLALTYENLKVTPYYKLGLHDSVLYIVDKVKSRYHSLGLDEKAAESQYLAINAYIETGRLDEAWQSILVFERESGIFDAAGNISSGREIYYYLKAKYFEAIGQTDSVERLCRKLLKYDGDINNLEAGYKGLLFVYRTKENRDSIGKYADLYCEANDSAHAKLLSNDISRLKAMYDYSSYKRKSEEMKIKSEVAKRNSLLVLFIVFIVVLVFSYIGLSYRKRKKAEINLLLEDYDQTLQIIDELNADKEMMLINHKKQLESIKSSLQQKGVTIESESRDKEVSEVVLAKFRKIANEIVPSDLCISADDWHNLILEMSNCDSHYMLLLRESNLSDNERKIATLIRLNFSDYQIKRIINSYGSALPNYKARINKKMFNQASAKTLRYFIGKVK